MIKQMSRVISVFDRKTSMRLTDVEWRIIDEICFSEKLKRKKLIEQIAQSHNNCLKLTPAIRLFSLLYLYHKRSDRNKFEPYIEQILKQLL